MALQSIGHSAIKIPGIPDEFASANAAGLNMATAHTMDAAAEKVSFHGYVFIPTGGSKTISSAGGKIHWRSGAVTNAGATTMRCGIQDLVTTAGTAAPARPGGTYDVFGDKTGAGTVTSNAWQTHTMSSGSKVITDGQLISIVLEMTARGGTDIIIAQCVAAASSIFPGISIFTTSWATQNGLPVAVIEFDDGTFGCLRGTFNISTFQSLTYTDGSATDEYGVLFQVPYRCKVNQVGGIFTSSTSTGDAEFRLYSSPLTTPVLMASVAHLGEHAASTANNRPAIYSITEQTLEPNTDYCIALKATGAGNVVLCQATLANAAYRTLFSGTTTRRQGSRANLTGAFTEATTQFPMLYVYVSALDDGAGSGGGGNTGVVHSFNGGLN